MQTRGWLSLPCFSTAGHGLFLFILASFQPSLQMWSNWNGPLKEQATCDRIESDQKVAGCKERYWFVLWTLVPVPPREQVDGLLMFPSQAAGMSGSFAFWPLGLWSGVALMRVGRLEGEQVTESDSSLPLTFYLAGRGS